MLMIDENHYATRYVMQSLNLINRGRTIPNVISIKLTNFVKNIEKLSELLIFYILTTEIIVSDKA